MLIYRINFWLIEKIKIPTKSVVFAIDGMRQNADIVILKPWVFYSQRDGYMFYGQLQHARFHIGYWHGINVKNHQYSKIDIGMEKKIMKKRAVMALIALSLAIQLTACKADTEKVVSTEYEQMINLNNDGEMTIFETEAEQEIVTTEEQEADGNEEIETRELAANADVYSKPDTEATVVGNLKKGKNISVIALSDDEKWCKIAYSGRVAYVKADKVKQSNGNEAEKRTEKQKTDDVGETATQKTQQETQNTSANQTVQTAPAAQTSNTKQSTQSSQSNSTTQSSGSGQSSQTNQSSTGGKTEQTPSTEKPSTEKPSTETPATETPSTEKPSTETPGTEEKPSTETPGTEEKPSTETPSTEKPSTETPGTEEKPSTETPGTEEKPSTDEKTPTETENPSEGQPTGTGDGE